MPDRIRNLYGLLLPTGTKKCVHLGHFGNVLSIVMDRFERACGKHLQWHSV
jgi:hypothetical protein